MIKLIASELLFDKTINVYVRSYPTGIQDRVVYINPELVESVVVKEVEFYTEHYNYYKNWLGKNCVHCEVTELMNIKFYELTMASGVKYLTRYKLDYIKGLGELR